MRRLAGLVAGGAALLALAAPAAQAAPANVQAGVAGPDPNLFSAAAFAHDAGAVATMTWVAGGSHNVTAGTTGPDGKPLFRSPTVGSGATAVQGTQYVPQGVYAFSCTIHPGMNSALNVNAGAPQPRPKVALKAKGQKLAKVVKKRKLIVTMSLSGGQRATVTVKLGKRAIGRAGTAKSGKLAVKLSGKGVKTLKRKRKAKLKLDASVDFGSPAKAKAILK